MRGPALAAVLLAHACGDDPDIPPECGNGRLDPGEDCDDGNLAVLDGCSQICTLEVELEIDTEINLCPVIDRVAIAPSAGPLGARMHVDFIVEDPDGDIVGMTWDAPGGTLEVTTSSTAVYRCEARGLHKLRVTAFDEECFDEFEAGVVCY